MDDFTGLDNYIRTFKHEAFRKAVCMSRSTAPTRRWLVPSGEYTNLFVELPGKSDVEIQAKLDAAWEHLFYGNDTTERVYYPAGDDRACIQDTGNGDVRTEGMSCGMMIAVQIDE